MPYGVSWKRFLSDLYAKLNDDNVFNGAAALGFYLTLAIFPAMIAIMAVLPYLPIARVDLAIMDLLQQTLPPSAAEMFSDVVREVTSERRRGVLSFGIAAALWAASTGMYAIMQQLNITYDVKEARSFVRARVVALGLTLLVGSLMLGALSLVVLGGVIQDWIGNRFGFSTGLLTFFAVLRWVIIAAAVLTAFGLVYWLAPNVDQRFHFITPGSIVGGLLLIIASVGFSLYAANFADYDATYGSIGAVIVLMLWLYIAGLVMLLGSEINVLKERYSPGGKSEGERTPGEHRLQGTSRAQRELPAEKAARTP
jgi:membrane protein